MRTHKGLAVVVVALALVLGAGWSAQAATNILSLSAVQYNGGAGLFVAFLTVGTNDPTIDATLLVPHEVVVGGVKTAALHPIAHWNLPGKVIFKFAVRGKAVLFANEEIHALVTDKEGLDDPDAATATCRAFGHLFFLCR